MATLKCLLLLALTTCVLGKLKRGQVRGQHLWKKKQAAIEARSAFNELWDSSLGKMHTFNDEYFALATHFYEFMGLWPVL